MTVGARAVANELLDVAEDMRSSIDPLQLQKLLYLAQGWTLGLSGDPLFLEPIEAWAYGPVVPEIYHSVKMFGASPIRGRLLTIDRVRRRVIVAHEQLDELESDVLKARLGKIWYLVGG